MREPQFLLKKILSFKLVSNPETEMTARSWCAARAMEHPLDRVWCIWARREGQSAEISPTEMTCSRYSATRVLNSCTVLRKTNHQTTRKDTILLCVISNATNTTNTLLMRLIATLLIHYAPMLLHLRVKKSDLHAWICPLVQSWAQVNH